jgi:hypothetical protein
MQHFNFTAGCNTARLGAARLNRRVGNSRKHAKDKGSKRRELVRAAKLKRQAEEIQLEGGPAYGSGQF